MSKKPLPSAAVVADLRRDLQRLHDEIDKPSLSAPARRRLEEEVRKVISELGTFLNDLDPIRQPTSMFDPGNPKIVGRFISLALVAQQRHPIDSVARFYGSGVYAIYYKGAFGQYRAISGTETPIYVGQAAPAISNARTALDQGDRLCRRLDDHRKNIGKAKSTLDIADFEIRSLVVQSGWETAAEDYLIHLFRPIWNNEIKILYGLGKHGDSAETRGNKRSPWDTLHPGRDWAADTKHDAKTKKQIEDELVAHFKAHPVFPDLESVLKSFIDELSQV
jgi:hypothetical protein